MKIRVRFFGPAAETAGCSETDVEAEGTVAGAIAAVLEKHPGLESLSGGMKYARNTEYATPESPLEEGDILSFLPPVGGG